MIGLLIFFWNLLFTAVPTPLPENQYESPLHGYQMQVKSVDTHEHAFTLIRKDINSDSDDSDDSEDNDDDTDETAYLHKILINCELVDLRLKHKAVFKYVGRLSQAHTNPIITPPDSHTRYPFIA